MGEVEWTEDTGASSDAKEKTRAEIVEEFVKEISHELKVVHGFKYDAVQAEKTAALCLEAQKELSEFLSDSELRFKEQKIDVERIEAEVYTKYKKNGSEGMKITEPTLKALVAQDKDVISAKKNSIRLESEFGKWKNLFNVLKDGHIFFRGLAKGKNDWV